MPQKQIELTESQIKRQILDYLSARRDVLCWNNPNIGRGRVNQVKRGVSDILGLFKGTGRLICIEVKTPKGKISGDQLIFLNQVAMSGACAFVARSVEDVIKHLHDTSIYDSLPKSPDPGAIG